eukprot:1266467-Rhodomonas_salina.1
MFSSLGPAGRASRGARPGSPTEGRRWRSLGSASMSMARMHAPSLGAATPCRRRPPQSRRGS